MFMIDRVWTHNDYMNLTKLDRSQAKSQTGTYARGYYGISMLSYAHMYQETENSKSCNDCIHLHLHLQASTMDASQYWPFTHEYSIWSAAVETLQFWMADLK